MGDGCYQDVMVDADAMQAKRIDAVFWCSFISLSLEDFSGGKMRGVDLHPPLSMDFVNATRNKIDATLNHSNTTLHTLPWPYSRCPPSLNISRNFSRRRVRMSHLLGILH